MTPSVNVRHTVTHEDLLEPANKKRKVSSLSQAQFPFEHGFLHTGRVSPQFGGPCFPRDYTNEGLEPGTTIHAHPLGVKPLGNEKDDTKNLKICCGKFGALPDELLLQVLEYLDSTQLVRLGSCCKALYAFCRFDDIWKSLFVQSARSDDRWQGTWRDTYLSLPPIRSTSISCNGLFSDALYRPFQCANINLTPFAQDIPLKNQIARLTNLTHDDFTKNWASKPFILTSPVKSWPIYRTWDLSSLLYQYENISFRAESVDWPLDTYVKYMRSTTDESPLYLFDRAFASKMNLHAGSSPYASYTPPSCFGTDLFAVLGSKRPDSSWLIIGPSRSGSTFHKDPNGTSAWNAVIRGSKYWIMFPSSDSLPPPPGVYTSIDQSEVTSPLSIAEWLLTFHAEARATPGCKEGVCGVGEVLHVPSGWFHLVVNLEESVAVTQNFVPEAHLSEVLEFLRNRKEQVSGFGSDVKDPYGEFVEGLRKEQPDLLEQALAESEQKRNNRGWEQIVGSKNNEGRVDGFSFGFEGGHEDETDEEECDRDTD